MSAVPGSLKVTRCTVKPAPVSSVSRTPSAPPSAGVTDGQRSRSWAMATRIGVVAVMRAAVRACGSSGSGPYWFGPRVPRRQPEFDETPDRDGRTPISDSTHAGAATVHASPTSSRRRGWARARTAGSTSRLLPRSCRRFTPSGEARPGAGDEQHDGDQPDQHRAAGRPEQLLRIDAAEPSNGEDAEDDPGGDVDQTPTSQYLPPVDAAAES